MKVFNRIALVARVVSEQIADSLRLVERFLLEHGKEVYIENNSATMLGESNHLKLLMRSAIAAI